MTSILRTSGVLGLPILTSMALEFLRIVLLIWRQSIAAAVTLCKDSALAVLPENTFWSCWGAWWMTLNITLLTLFPPRGSYSGGLRYKSLLAWALLWSSFWTIFMRLPEPSSWRRFNLLLMLLIHASRLWGKRWQTWRVVVSAFFLVLVDPAVLEISLLFLGFIDDDVISPLFLLLFFLSSSLVHFMFSITLIWQVWYDCHSLGL